MVVDASAVVEWLLRSPAGMVVEERLREHRTELHAPAFVLVEVASALRRLLVRGLVDETRADLSFVAARSLPLVLHDLPPFLDRIWALRHAVSSYDAAYVALAEAVDAPLLTCDARLGRSPGHTAHIEVAATPSTP